MADQLQQQDGNRVAVFNPKGELETIEARELRQAVQDGGYRIASPDEVREFNDQQKYGEGAGNAFKALGYGAARTATGGLSDQFLTKSGLVAPSELRGLQQYNPGSDFLGQGLGVVGALAAPEIGIAGEAGEAAAAANGLRAADFLNPVQGVSKLGKTVAEGALPTAEGAANLIANPETSPIAHKILSQGSAHALGSAVEGAAYGLGQSVSEQALGDPDLNAEKVMSNIGYGALFGGALGGALKAGEVGVPDFISKAQESLSKVMNPLKEGAEESFVKGASFVSGKPEETIREALQNRALSLKNPEEEIDIIRSFSNDLQDQYESLSKASGKATAEVRPEETRAMLEGADPLSADAELYRIKNKLQETISKMQESPGVYPKGFADKLENFVKELDSSASKSGEFGKPSDIYEALNELKQKIDPVAKMGKKAGVLEQDAVNEFKSLRSEIKGSLENESVWGEAGARQSAYNDALSENLFYKQQFEKTFMKKAITRGGGVTYKIDPSKVRSFFSNIKNLTGEERMGILDNYLQSSKGLLDEIEGTYKNAGNKNFDKSTIESLIQKNQGVSNEAIKQAEFHKTLQQLGAGGHNFGLGEAAAAFTAAHNPALGAGIEGFTMMRSPGIAIQRLAKIEKLAQSTTKAIAKASKGIFQLGIGGLRMELPILAPTMAKQKLDKDKKYERVARDVSRFSSNPSGLMEKLENATGEMDAHAPHTAQALQAKAGAATAFLDSKLPKMPPQGPLSAPFKPSKSEVSQFMKYYETVENPVSVLEHVKDGTISMEHMETLKTVYPKLLEEMQSQVMSELVNFAANKKEKLPYSKQLALSFFLDQDLNSSMSGQSILANQASMKMNLQAENQQGPGLVKPTAKGMSDLSQSSQMLTEMQKVSQRQA